MVKSYWNPPPNPFRKDEALRLADLLEMESINAATELRRLYAENEALRKDAERYRWLRENSNSDVDIYVGNHGICNSEDIDETIDAEMKGQS